MARLKVNEWKKASSIIFFQWNGIRLFIPTPFLNFTHFIMKKKLSIDQLGESNDHWRLERIESKSKAAP